MRLLPLRRDTRGLASFLSSQVRTQEGGHLQDRKKAWGTKLAGTLILDLPASQYSNLSRQRHLPTLNLHFHLLVECLPHNCHHNYYRKFKRIKMVAIFPQQTMAHRPNLAPNYFWK